MSPVAQEQVMEMVRSRIKELQSGSYGQGGLEADKEELESLEKRLAIVRERMASTEEEIKTLKEWLVKNGAEQINV